LAAVAAVPVALILQLVALAVAVAVRVLFGSNYLYLPMLTLLALAVQAAQQDQVVLPAQTGVALNLVALPLKAEVIAAALVVLPVAICRQVAGFWVAHMLLAVSLVALAVQAAHLPQALAVRQPIFQREVQIK
jgi:hypothetical protein